MLFTLACEREIVLLASYLAVELIRFRGLPLLFAFTEFTFMIEQLKELIESN